jgi:ribonucleoside-diphosphate reductase subunit M2
MVDSPAKKLDFASADKENVFRPIVGIPDLPEDEAPVAKTGTAATIRPEEAHEPLLQENPNRFVLFPIKYHDVSLSRVTTCLTRLNTRLIMVRAHANAT